MHSMECVFEKMHWKLKGIEREVRQVTTFVLIKTIYCFWFCLSQIFDLCDGHPDQSGRYHYHKKPTSCLLSDPSQMIGVAFDGFAIYGPVDENGKTLTSDDLDECHGR